MSLRIVVALISKDFSLFFRNRFFALITALGLVVYVAIYFVMPGSVNETLEIGLYAPVIPPIFEQLEIEGLEIEIVESEEVLMEAVAAHEYVAGMVLPSDTTEKPPSGQKPQIAVYFASDTPAETKDAVVFVINEMVHLQTGQPLSVEVVEEVLGPDRVGTQIPPRDRLRPLFAVLLIIAETYGLATLISEEIERRTIQALLVTPMRVRDFFVAKGITGTTLAFGQAALFMAIVGGMSGQPVIVLIALLLGAVLVTGIGFAIASLAKDMMSVIVWGVVALVILVIPAVSVIFPGPITDWVKVIPSYYLVDTVDLAANFGSGWSGVWHNLLILLGFDLVIVAIGIMFLRRRVL